MERKLLDMMNQLSISEYNPRMKYCDFPWNTCLYSAGIIALSAKNFRIIMQKQRKQEEEEDEFDGSEYE